MQFEVKVQINKPVKDVFKYISNFSNHADIFSANVESRQTSGGPLQVGSTMKNITKIMGRRMEEHFIVTEFTQDRLIAKESVPGSTFISGDKMTFEEVNGGTLLIVSAYANLTGFMKLFDGYLGKKVKLALTEDMERLKKNFEEGKI